MKLSKTATLLLVGAAAYGIYKFYNMSDEQKAALKEKGKKLFDDHISPLISQTLGMTEDPSLVEQAEPVK